VSIYDASSNFLFLLPEQLVMYFPPSLCKPSLGYWMDSGEAKRHEVTFSCGAYLEGVLLLSVEGTAVMHPALLYSESMS
jgi:hypothetical protein